MTFHSSDHSLNQKGTNLCRYSSHYCCNIAAQMWCLCRFLPLMIGDNIPETDIRWHNFLQLLEIIDLLFAPVLSQYDIMLILHSN